MVGAVSREDRRKRRKREHSLLVLLSAQRRAKLRNVLVLLQGISSGSSITRRLTGLTRGTSVATFPPRLTTSRYSPMAILMVRNTFWHLVMDPGRQLCDPRSVGAS